MSFIQGLVLGIVQGIAEFLPISSSGHLMLLREVMGLGDIPTLFDILLHIATLIVVVFVFRVRIIRLLVVLFRFVRGQKKDQDASDLRMIVFVLVSTFMTGVIGILFKKLGLIDNMTVTSLAFISTGLFLFTSLFVKPKRGYDELKLSDSLLIGAAQGIGTIPGISRSGITISAALMKGVDRETAGEYSFIISVPAILGALILDLGDGGTLLDKVPLFVMISSFIITIVSGYFALTLLIKLLQKGRFYLFSFYLIPLGIFSFLYLR